MTALHSLPGKGWGIFLAKKKKLFDYVHVYYFLNYNAIAHLIGL